MKIKELKNKIIIAELDPDAEYICVVNPQNVRIDTLIAAIKPYRHIPIVIAHNIDKSIRFIKIPKKKEGER